MYWRFSNLNGFLLLTFLLLLLILMQVTVVCGEDEKATSMKKTIESFRQEIQEQEDQLFGITLYFKGICVIYQHDKEIIDINREAYENITERGNAFIKQAKQLLHEAERDPSKVKLIREFQFPPIYGPPMANEMTRRARILYTEH